MCVCVHVELTDCIKPGLYWQLICAVYVSVCVMPVQVSGALNPDSSESSKAFQECVLARHPRHGEFAIAFITGRTVLQVRLSQWPMVLTGRPARQHCRIKHLLQQQFRQYRTQTAVGGVRCVCCVRPLASKAVAQA